MSRVRLHRTEAIVLRRRDYGEADRILTLYTPDRGKVHAIAKGVRRIASRKAGHVELFVHTGVLLAEGRNLDIVTQAETIRTYRRLRDDLTRTAYACHLAELVDRLVADGVASPTTFELLGDALGALDDGDDPGLVARFFELRLLALLGYRPQLFACTRCDRALGPAGNAFSSSSGGVVCPECRATQRDALALDERPFRVLRFLQGHGWAEVRRLAVTPDTSSALERVMHDYLLHLAERELRSAEFLIFLRRSAAAADRPTPLVDPPGEVPARP